MRDLSAFELAAVAGGNDMPVVVITGERMTDEEKAEYDAELDYSSPLLDTGSALGNFLAHIWNVCF